jgi:hypothetical protein
MMTLFEIGRVCDFMQAKATVVQGKEQVNLPCNSEVKVDKVDFRFARWPDHRPRRPLRYRKEHTLLAYPQNESTDCRQYYYWGS